MQLSAKEANLIFRIMQDLSGELSYDQGAGASARNSSIYCRLTTSPPLFGTPPLSALSLASAST